jgi:hypothetical protein
MTKLTSHYLLIAAAAAMLSACGEADARTGPQGQTVETSGKEAAVLDALPPEVLAAARAARPELTITQAEHELRDGKDYYDVGGTMPDGSELELDMTRVDGEWMVVEFQRDIEFDVAPDAVRSALDGHAPDWRPERIIESDQGDGIVIYEFFGDDASGEPVKIEVKWQQGVAEVLRDEWQH